MLIVTYHKSRGDGGGAATRGGRGGTAANSWGPTPGPPRGTHPRAQDCPSPAPASSVTTTTPWKLSKAASISCVHTICIHSHTYIHINSSFQNSWLFYGNILRRPYCVWIKNARGWCWGHTPLVEQNERHWQWRSFCYSWSYVDSVISFLWEEYTLRIITDTRYDDTVLYKPCKH